MTRKIKVRKLDPIPPLQAPEPPPPPVEPTLGEVVEGLLTRSEATRPRWERALAESAERCREFNAEAAALEEERKGRSDELAWLIWRLGRGDMPPGLPPWITNREE